jgi:DNA-binding response OmpR family regulator
MMIRNGASKILVIEDNREVSGLLLIIFQRGGFDACATSTGTEGLRLAETENYDLILSDIDLPDINGFEICRLLKQDPKLRTIPVVLMSGRLKEGNETRALKLGAADYFAKPFEAESILRRVSVHIVGRNR